MLLQSQYWQENNIYIIKSLHIEMSDDLLSYILVDLTHPSFLLSLLFPYHHSMNHGADGVHSLFILLIISIMSIGLVGS